MADPGEGSLWFLELIFLETGPFSERLKWSAIDPCTGRPVIHLLSKSCSQQNIHFGRILKASLSVCSFNAGLQLRLIICLIWKRPSNELHLGKLRLGFSSFKKYSGFPSIRVPVFECFHLQVLRVVSVFPRKLNWMHYGPSSKELLKSSDVNNCINIDQLKFLFHVVVLS